MLWRKRLKPDDPEKREKLQEELRQEGGPVSYTHLTLPTTHIV